MTTEEKCLEVTCKVKKAKDFVDYGNGVHFCHGKMRIICPVCKYTEAILSSKFQFATIYCSECNSEVRTYAGKYRKSGSVIRGIRQE